MANVEHNSLAGANLHENKGVAAATNNTVATASSGATVWKVLDNTNVGPLANPFGSAYIHLQEQQPQGTNAGNFSNGAWRTRQLNTKLTDDVGIGALSSGTFSLPAGTYYIYASAPGYFVNFHQSKLVNTTDSVDLILGTSEASANGVSNLYSRSHTMGRFTLSGTKTIAFQHRCSTSNNTGNGFGEAGNFASTSSTPLTGEVYADVQIWKTG